MRKWLACALTLSVLVTSAPVAAFAESDTNGYDIFPQGSVVREETLSEGDASESIDERDLIYNQRQFKCGWCKYHPA